MTTETFKFRTQIQVVTFFWIPFVYMSYILYYGFCTSVEFYTNKILFKPAEMLNWLENNYTKSACFNNFKIHSGLFSTL